MTSQLEYTLWEEAASTARALRQGGDRSAIGGTRIMLGSAVMLAHLSAVSEASHNAIDFLDPDLELLRDRETIQRIYRGICALGSGIFDPTYQLSHAGWGLFAALVTHLKGRETEAASAKLTTLSQTQFDDAVTWSARASLYVEYGIPASVRCL